MSLSVQDKILIEQRVTNESPSTAVAYVLWLFLGGLGAHRFYLGKPGTAVLQFLSLFILIGFAWVLIDAFLIPGMIRAKQGAIRERLANQYVSHGAVAVV